MLVLSFSLWPMFFLMDNTTFCLSTQSAGGRVGCLHVGAVVSNAAVKAPCDVFSVLSSVPPPVELLGHGVTPGLRIWETARLCSTAASGLLLVQAGLQSDRAGKQGRPQSLCKPPIFKGDCYKAVFRRRSPWSR